MSNVGADASITTVWPEGFNPNGPGVGAFAVREVAAPADAVFEWVRRVDLHADWYKGLHMVRRWKGAWPLVEKGTSLRFVVDGAFVPMVKVIQCDVAERRMAWGGGLPGLAICHAFTVEPIDESRSLLRSEEKWMGPVGKLVGGPASGTLQKVQTRWAEAITAAANAHPGGPPAA